MTDHHAETVRRFPPALTNTLTVVILASLAVLAESRETLLVVLGAAVSALFLAPLASYLTLALFCALLGMVTFTSEVPIPGLGFRVYSSDAILYLLALGGVAWMRNLRRSDAERLRRPAPEQHVMRLVLVMAVFGAAPFVKGLFLKHFDANDVLGDYRRMYIYPLAILVPLLIPLGPRHRDLLKYAIIGGAMLVMFTGAYRLATGQYWHTDNYTEFDYDPRLLSSTDTVTLELGLAYLAVVAASSGAWLKRAAALTLALGCAAFIVLSGWRLAVGFIVVSPAMAVLLLARLQRRRIAVAVKFAVVLGVLAALTVSALLAFAPREFARLEYKYEERVNSFDLGHDQRVWAWKRAFELWAAEPVLGAGLGQELLIYLRTSGGDFIGTVSTAHNVFMVVLYKSGSVGLVLFLLLHGRFVTYFFGRLRNIAPKRQIVAVSLFAGYLSSMITHSLEPFENAGIISLYMAMGFIILLLREDENAATTPPAAETEVGNTVLPLTGEA